MLPHLSNSLLKRQASLTCGTRTLTRCFGAEVGSTDRTNARIKSAAVGQTAIKKRLAQLQAVSKTAEYTVSSKPAVAALSRASRRHGPRALRWACPVSQAGSGSVHIEGAAETTVTAAKSSRPGICQSSLTASAVARTKSAPFV